MAYFPMFVDLKDKKIVIVGGGKVAYRKILKLLPFEAKIDVVAVDVCSEIKSLIKDNFNISVKNKKFETDDIKNAFFVICATDDNSINQYVAKICKDKNIPINSVDDIKNCSFLFPALIKRDSLTIACSTGGKMPDMAAYVKNKIEQSLFENIGEVIEILGLLRIELKNKINKQSIRAKILHGLLEYCQTKEFKISYNELHEKMQSLINEINEG